MSTGMGTGCGVGLGPVGSGRPDVTAFEGPCRGAGTTDEVVELRPGPQCRIGGPRDRLTTTDQGVGLRRRQETWFEVSGWPTRHPVVCTDDNVSVTDVLHLDGVSDGGEVGS